MIFSCKNLCYSGRYCSRSQINRKTSLFPRFISTVHMIHPYSIYLNPASQSLLPSPLKPQDISCTYMVWNIEWKFIFCVEVVIILLLPIYIFLHMNLLKAHIFPFHFSRLYIYYTFYLYYVCLFWYYRENTLTVIFSKNMYLPLWFLKNDWTPGRQYRWNHRTF